MKIRFAQQDHLPALPYIIKPFLPPPPGSNPGKLPQNQRPKIKTGTKKTRPLALASIGFHTNQTGFNRTLLIKNTVKN